VGRSPRRRLLRRRRHDLTPRHDGRRRRSRGSADTDVGAGCVRLGRLQFGDIGGELVRALPHRGETVRYRSELIARSGEGRTRARPARRTEPDEANQAAGTIGQSFAWPYRHKTAIPSGGNTAAGRDQKAGEGDQGRLIGEDRATHKQVQYGWVKSGSSGGSLTQPPSENCDSCGGSPRACCISPPQRERLKRQSGRQEQGSRRALREA
jgi:hypothetical protein